MAGFRLTTKVQVSGWRFLLRRVEHAIVRRDTRMFDDPLQFYSRAVSLGIVIAVLVCLGAALLAYFKPLGKRGGDNLLVDRGTNQLYVVMPGNGLLRPVYNLPSLITVQNDGAGEITYEVKQADVDQSLQHVKASDDPDKRLRRALRRLIEPIAGDVLVERYQPIKDASGQVMAYRVWAHR